MIVYFIYAFINQHDLNIANRYGQYDLFKHSKEIDGLSCALWGFTDNKDIKNQFLEERPVPRRYIVEKKDMSESEYSNYMMDHFRFELLPAYLSTKIEIGPKSGYNKTDVMKTKVSKKETSEYMKRIVTKYEFDYVVNNLGEICTAMEGHLFGSLEIPGDKNVYVAPVAKLMELTNFEFQMMVYQLPFSPRCTPEVIRRASQNLNDVFSVASIFYHVFAEMIYREVIE